VGDESRVEARGRGVRCVEGGYVVGVVCGVIGRGGGGGGDYC